MNVLFLYVSTNMCRDGDLWYYDEGVASVASCLRAAGHTPKFKMVTSSHDRGAVQEWVRHERGDNAVLVYLTSLLFSAYGHDLPNTFPRMRGLKQYTGLPTVFVGLHATTNSETLIADPEVDFVGRGEMEEALVELVDALEAGTATTGIANIWAKEGAMVHRNPLRPLLRDLASLPFPARDLLPTEQQANERDGILTLVAARGCPMDCSFCANHVIRKIYDVTPASFVRLKPVSYLIDEIVAAREADPSIQGVFFHDDIFGMQRRWLDELLERFPNEVGLPFGCNLVMAQVTPELAKKLHQAGCRHVQIGVESGSDYLRNEVLSKSMPEAQIKEALRACHDAGLLVKFFAIMGVPEEDRAHFVESLKGFSRFRPDMIQIQVWEAHDGSTLQGRDPNAAERARLHYTPGKDLAAWRLKFYFRWFHRLVALYAVLGAMAETAPRRARVLRGLLTLAVRFRYAPDLMLTRDWNGRRRLLPYLLGAPLLWAGLRRMAGRTWQRAAALEQRLAADYLRPDDAPDPLVAQAWSTGERIDRRRLEVANVV